MSTTATQTTLEAATASLSLRGTPTPLKSTGLLDRYDHFDNTPVIGRQFNDLQLSDLLKAENSDDLVRELAVIVSQRNVCFFKNQSLTIDEQKILINSLGRLSGKPAVSGLHIHPITEEASELGDEISVISSDKRQAYQARSRFASSDWHSDITFERVPSDFAALKIHTLPGPTGGDTLWASAYEAYDRLSPALQQALSGMTAVHDGNWFHDVAKKLGHPLREIERGNPLNKGPVLDAIHPVVRTNPITGWRGLFVNHNFTKRIVELNKDESDLLLGYLFRLVSENHDLQVRFKWDKNDVAIWSNTSTFHSATWDYGAGRRVGDRVVSIGEKPYFDPASKGRREALGLPQW